MNESLFHLSEVCDFIKDGTHGSPDRRNEGIPVLSAENVNDGSLNFSTRRFTTESELAVFRKRLHPLPGDVLLTIVGSIGRTAIVADTKPFVFQRSVCVLRPRPEVLDSAYLRYSLESEAVKRQIDRETRQVAQAGVYLESLNRITIALRDFPEQRRIAQRLEKADRLRRMRRYALELSGTFLQSVFLEVFGDPIRNPRSWNIERFGDIGKLDRGKSKHRPRNAPHLYGGKYPFVQTGDIANCANYVTRHHQNYSEEGLKQSKLWPAGTLCITIAANIAKTGILTYPACFPDSVVGFLPGEKVMTEFIQYWLSFLQEQIERTAPESAQKNINLEILRRLLVPIPDLSLQEKFSEIVGRFERLRADQRESLRQAEHLFQTLLHDAFKGN